LRAVAQQKKKQDPHPPASFSRAREKEAGGRAVRL
jgi:hypothetical protein